MEPYQWHGCRRRHLAVVSVDLNRVLLYNRKTFTDNCQKERGPMEHWNRYWYRQGSQYACLMLVLTVQIRGQGACMLIGHFSLEQAERERG
jgi:hypothetical protein